MIRYRYAPNPSLSETVSAIGVLKCRIGRQRAAKSPPLLQRQYQCLCLSQVWRKWIDLLEWMVLLEWIDLLEVREQG